MKDADYTKEILTFTVRVYLQHNLHILTLQNVGPPASRNLKCFILITCAASPPLLNLHQFWVITFVLLPHRVASSPTPTSDVRMAVIFIMSD